MLTWTGVFQKSCFGCSGGSIFQDLGAQVGSKNRLKIDPKVESKMGCILASIFKGFWWLFGSKLRRKMEPRSIQEGIEKAMEKMEGTKMVRRSKKRRSEAPKTPPGSAPRRPKTPPKTAQVAQHGIRHLRYLEDELASPIRHPIRHLGPKL